MCDEKIKLSNAASMAMTEPELTAANRALLDHLELCSECMAQVAEEYAARARLVERLQHDDVALLAWKVAQS